MFRWLFGPKAPKQNIFHYHDGTKARSADPITVERALIAVLGMNWRSKVESIGKDIPFGLTGEDLDQANNNREKALSEVLYAIDSAFDVKPFKDGEGVTHVARLGILTAFNLFCRDLVDHARPFVKQQSRASPGQGPSPTVSGAESSSPGT